MKFPSEAAQYLESSGVDVDRVISLMTSGRVSDISPSPIKYDEGCAECGKSIRHAKLLEKDGFQASRIEGVIDRLSDNYLWSKGSHLSFVVVGKWPSDEIKHRVFAALEVASWVWTEMNLGLTLSAVAESTEATHVVMFGGDPQNGVAAQATFPKDNGLKKITYFLDAFKTRTELSVLLGRTIHEMGHCLGFYHEFEDNTMSIHVGGYDQRSIMGYDRNRYVTQTDLTSFPEIYSIPHDTVVDNRTGTKVLYKNPALYNIRGLDLEAAVSKGVPKFMHYFKVSQTVVEACVRTKIKSTRGLDLKQPPTLSRNGDEDIHALVDILHLNSKTVHSRASDALGWYPKISRSSDGAPAVAEVDSAKVAAACQEESLKAGVSTASLVQDAKTPVKDEDGVDVTVAANCGEWLLSKFTQMTLVNMMTLRKKGKATIRGQEVHYKAPDELSDAEKEAYDASMYARVSMMMVDDFALGFALGISSRQNYQRAYKTSAMTVELNVAMVVDALKAGFTGMPTAVIEQLSNVLTAVGSKVSAGYSSNKNTESSTTCGYVATYDWKPDSSAPNGGQRVARFTFYSIEASASEWSKAIKIGKCSKGEAHGYTFTYNLILRNVDFKPRIVKSAMVKDENAQAEVQATMSAKIGSDAAALLGLSSESSGVKGSVTKEDEDHKKPNVDLSNKDVMSFFTDA